MQRTKRFQVQTFTLLILLAVPDDGCTSDGKVYSTMDLCARTCPSNGKCFSNSLYINKAEAPKYGLEWGKEDGEKGYVCVIKKPE